MKIQTNISKINMGIFSKAIDLYIQANGVAPSCVYLSSDTLKEFDMGMYDSVDGIVFNIKEDMRYGEIEFP